MTGKIKRCVGDGQPDDPCMAQQSTAAWNGITDTAAGKTDLQEIRTYRPLFLVRAGNESADIDGHNNETATPFTEFEVTLHSVREQHEKTIDLQLFADAICGKRSSICTVSRKTRLKMQLQH